MTDQYLSKIAKTVEPYAWEEGVAPDMLRFDSNTPAKPPACLEQFLEAMKMSCPINEYTDPSYKKLKRLIALYENVDTDRVTVSNSGDEAIDILAKTFLNPGNQFIITPPTYEMFQIQCQINGGRSLEIPLTGGNYQIEKEKIIMESKNDRVKLIFLCNPNNPTATVISQSDIEDIVSRSQSIVVVDETYREFYGKSSVDLLRNNKNLVILRSFSKFGSIAGARVGYLMANPDLSEKFDAIRFPMGISYFSCKLAEMVLEDKGWINKNSEEIIREREKLKNNFKDMGFQVSDSRTNFLLVKIGKRAAEICAKLRIRKILVRDRSQKKYLEGCVRITVRSDTENQILIKAIKEILNEKQI